MTLTMAVRLARGLGLRDCASEMPSTSVIGFVAGGWPSTLTQLPEPAYLRRSPRRLAFGLKSRVGAASASVWFVLRSSSEFARISLKGNWIDFPGETVVRVRRDDPALSVELDDLGTHGVGLVIGAVAVGVVEERFDPARLVAVTHVIALDSRGLIPLALELSTCRSPRAHLRPR